MMKGVVRASVHMIWFNLFFCHVYFKFNSCVG